MLGCCRVRRQALGSVLGSAVLRCLVGGVAEAFFKVWMAGLALWLSCDAMLARVWPATARCIGSILSSRNQRIGRTRQIPGRSGDREVSERVQWQGAQMFGFGRATDGTEDKFWCAIVALMRMWLAPSRRHPSLPISHAPGELVLQPGPTVPTASGWLLFCL